MECTIISSASSLAAITEEWDLLQARVSRFPFSNPVVFQAWWHTQGKRLQCELHVVMGRQDGKLVALAPLVVVHRLRMRILEWGGGELFDYCDHLLASDAWSEPLWDAIRRSQLYDFGLLRDIHPAASCKATLATFAHSVGSKPISRIRFEWPSSSAWMDTALSTSTRAYYRRAERRLAERGTLRFEICRSPTPDARVLNALLRQKTEWLRAQEKQSWLLDDRTTSRALLNQIVETASDAGHLHLCWLTCNDQIIATHLGFVQNGILHWYLPTYDVEWAKYAPGRLLLLKLIGNAIDEGLVGFDFMRGDEPYKAQLANDSFELTDVLFTRSRIARLVEPALVAWYQRQNNASGTRDRNPPKLEPVQ
jgi:CelD/BcsL family acetyltransferase involved in cellulose biosynthesis